MSGTVYWLTGLAGAGKTSVGKLLYDDFKKLNNTVVFLDGDELRSVFGKNSNHTVDDRKKLAFQYAGLCRMLARQDIDVICATISMFHAVHAWNRKNIINYVEIYLKVPMEVLIARDQKQLYSRARKGQVENVMGVDIDFEEPVAPDIRLVNDGNTSLTELVSRLAQQINEKKFNIRDTA